MHLTDIPGIAAAGWVQVEYLAFSQFVVENGIEVIEGQCPPFQVVGSLVGNRRIDVVVTQSRIDGIMDSSLALACLIALAIKIQNLRASLVEDIAGNDNTINLVDGLLLTGEIELAGKAVHCHDMKILVGLGQEIEMQVGCHDNVYLLLGSLIVRRAACQGESGPEAQ